MLAKTIHLLLFMGLSQYCLCDVLDDAESSETCFDDFLASDDNGTSEYHSMVTTSVNFYLLTPSNDTIRLNSSNLGLVNASLPTKVLIHGLGTTVDHVWVDRMAYVYHTNGNYNVIATDWAVVTTHETDFLASVVDSVGHEIGTFLIECTTSDVVLMSDVHLIGSSVGAHVAGAAGQAVAKNGTKVGRITGLDPTEPEDLQVLDPSDAEFVDVIHTTVDVGQLKMGTVDFYVVDGQGRPVCDNATAKGGNGTANGTKGFCGELLADEYYISTIEDSDRFVGVSCYDDIIYAVRKVCDKAHSAYMGEYVSRNATGSYLVSKDAAGGLYSRWNFLLASTSALVLWYLCL